MGIVVIDDSEDIYITKEQHNRFQKEYDEFCKYAWNPPSFETFVKSKTRQSVTENINPVWKI